MSNVTYIKPDYRLKEAQEELRHDAIILLSMNMTNNYKRHHGRGMTREEIEKKLDLFRKAMYSDNRIEEWNQTS